MQLVRAIPLRLVQGAVEIRIPTDKGIAGECFTTEKTINIPDAYKDSRFNQVGAAVALLSPFDFV